MAGGSSRLVSKGMKECVGGKETGAQNPASLSRTSAERGRRPKGRRRRKLQSRGTAFDCWTEESAISFDRCFSATRVCQALCLAPRAVAVNRRCGGTIGALAILSLRTARRVTKFNTVGMAPTFFTQASRRGSVIPSFVPSRGTSNGSCTVKIGKR